jgi:hypothetical protein
LEHDLFGKPEAHFSGSCSNGKLTLDSIKIGRHPQDDTLRSRATKAVLGFVRDDLGADWPLVAGTVHVFQQL